MEKSLGVVGVIGGEDGGADAGAVVQAGRQLLQRQGFGPLPGGAVEEIRTATGLYPPVEIAGIAAPGKRHQASACPATRLPRPSTSAIQNQ